MSLVSTAEINPNGSVLEQIHALKKQREARMQAAARKLNPKPPAPKQLAQLPPPELFQRPVNPFDWLDKVMPVHVQQDNVQVTFKFPAWLEGNSRVTVGQIVKQVAEKYGVKPIDITSERRHHNLIVPRFEACWRARTETGYSLPHIGRAMGGRDHTSILHGYQTYARWQRIKQGLTRAKPSDRHVDFKMIIGPEAGE